MVTFVDKITSGRRYLHIQPSENDVDGEETKLLVRNPITSLCKPDCVRGSPSLPWWLKENLKTGKTFFLSTHVKMKENLPSYQLLRHDIESERRSWVKLSLHGEFSYKPLYWEWLEDILVRCKDKLTTLHLFDALYASLFLYDRCSNLIRAVCVYWCPETNTLHTSIFDIYSFLGLPISGHLYDEVVPTQRELTSKLPLSCTYLFIAYHKLMQGRKGKPTIEQWISFWFRGRSKYHVSKKPDQDSRIPQPEILSPLTDAGAHGWSDYQAIFDELGVATGQCTKTFLAAFLSRWLCTFILLVRDAGYIRPGTFSIASLMAFGVGYCLPTMVLASIYKGLNELSHSSHPGRGGGHFPTHFLYAWLAKNFDACELVGEASSSSGMVKFSGLGRVKSPHASGSKRKCSDLSDTNISKDEGKLKPKLKIVRSGKPVEPFVPAMEDGSSRVTILGIDVGTPAMLIPAIPIQSIAPLPQDELPVGVREPSTRKVIELPPEGAENIMDILDAEPNPVECIGQSDDVNFKKGLAHVPLPSGSQCFPSVGRIPSFGKDLFDSRSRLVNSWGVCPPDDDEVESIHRVNIHSSIRRPQHPLKVPQGGISVFDADAFIKDVDKNVVRVLGKAILNKVCRTPFDGLPSLRGDFDSLYATILQRGVDVIPLEIKVERLIRQACDFKDLQQSYSGRISAEEHNNCHMEVQGKLDKASRRLNTEGTHYEAKAVKLKHVESSVLLLQEAERKVIDLQGQIEVLNATEVMDAATKASLEKAEAYIEESFEDLKNFQWDP
ncbi:hypothetical protein Cgig2_016349 [Carnegiea gigantea]|uniref:Aminotransferase-like plant mobile domain-containing protein n=1 Tax=Carnegiea gigantea TaxID=171969 RepID=A0A9Q1JVZ3_9CARY|nr:hypothetical protein Cgig2_016349 [Carnegiea gigantea]